MALPLDQAGEARVLWSAGVCDRQSIPPGRSYWWNNRNREPLGTVVLQATLEGEAVLDDAAGRHACRPGSLMLFVYGEPSAYGRLSPDGPAYTSQWVNLEGAGILEHINLLRQRHGPVLQLANIDGILAEMDELTALAHPSSPRRSDDPVTIAAAVHSLMMRLFDLSQQSLRQASRPVDWAVNQILRQPTRPWSLKEYADHYGVSREHLSRVFRQKTGQSAHSWLARARLEAAVRLLRETDLPVRQVAQQAGFASAHHLARCIRSATGRAPSDVRTSRKRSA